MHGVFSPLQQRQCLYRWSQSSVDRWTLTSLCVLCPLHKQHHVFLEPQSPPTACGQLKGLCFPAHFLIFTLFVSSSPLGKMFVFTLFSTSTWTLLAVFFALLLLWVTLGCHCLRCWRLLSCWYLVWLSFINNIGMAFGHIRFSKSWEYQDQDLCPLLGHCYTSKR